MLLLLQLFMQYEGGDFHRCIYPILPQLFLRVFRGKFIGFIWKSDSFRIFLCFSSSLFFFFFFYSHQLTVYAVLLYTKIGPKISLHWVCVENKNRKNNTRKTFIAYLFPSSFVCLPSSPVPVPFFRRDYIRWDKKKNVGINFCSTTETNKH